MPATYDCIATTTLASPAGSVSFSSIPSTYTDLVLVMQGGATASAATSFKVNNSTSGYADLRFWADGSSAATDRAPNSGEMYTGGGSFTDGMVIVTVMNYANTTTYKPIFSRYTNASNYTFFNVTTWLSTAAINSIQLGFNTSTTYVTGSTFTLYGIKAA